MRWLGHVALIAQQIGAYTVFVGKHKGKVGLDDLGADGGLVLKWILKTGDRKVWSEFIWLRIGASAGIL
jgi:hypothetical protein